MHDVAAVGPDVRGFQVGDAVSVIPGFDLNDYGFYGDLANAPAALVVHHPPSLSWVEATRYLESNRHLGKVVVTV